MVAAPTLLRAATTFHIHRPATRTEVLPKKPKTSLQGEKVEEQRSGAMRLEDGSEEIGRHPMRDSAKTNDGSIARSDFCSLSEGLVCRTTTNALNGFLSVRLSGFRTHGELRPGVKCKTAKNLTKNTICRRRTVRKKIRNRLRIVSY